MKIIPYLRVGTSYYKLVQAPTNARHFNEILVHWNIETIRQDDGKDYLSQVPNFDGFTCIPSHIDFKQEYKGFYNTYSPLPAITKDGIIKTTMTFIMHIFGNHL